MTNWIRYLIPPPSYKAPARPIVVTDERTYRHAELAVAQAEASGDVRRAYAGLTAMQRWLHREIHTGRRSKRASRSARLEQVELRKQQLIAGVVS